MGEYMAETFAELPEAEATGRIAEIYDEIRAALGAPMVNLVYRHMATVPGCLDWAWATLRPCFASGAIGDAAATLIAGSGAGPAAIIPRAALRLVGVDETGEAAAVTVLDAYNRANPLNLIAMKLLSRALADGAAADGGAPPGTPLPDSGALPVLPPQLDVASAPPDLAALLGELSRQAGMNQPGVTPTLYRHFGQWPGFLALAATAIATLTRLDDAAAEIERAAETAARAMPLYDVGLAPPAPESSATLAALIEIFPPTICRMIVIGAHLRRAMPS